MKPNNKTEDERLRRHTAYVNSIVAWALRSHGLSLEKIGRILDVSSSTVDQRLKALPWHIKQATAPRVTSARIEVRQARNRVLDIDDAELMYTIGFYRE